VDPKLKNCGSVKIDLKDIYDLDELVDISGSVISKILETSVMCVQVILDGHLEMKLDPDLEVHRSGKMNGLKHSIMINLVIKTCDVFLAKQQITIGIVLA
jgi:hypothetical protein